MEKSMLTVCMIVKNEEETIASSLASVSPFVDEIVVVDTGSIDRTQEIAAEFTKKVFQFPWCNDFAAARNFSVSKASNDWVLVLDGDESITEFDAEHVRVFIEDESNYKTVGRITIENITGSMGEEKNYIEKISRLFHKKYYRYEGIIHEQLVPIGKETLKQQLIEICVNHVGYRKECIDKKDKMNRNLNLLNQAILKNPNDPYLYYQKGKSSAILKNFKEACECFEKALSFPLNYKLEYAEDLAESYGYALLDLAQYEKALEIKVFLPYYKDKADFNFIMALIYMNNGKFQEAVNCFLKCTEAQSSKMQGITTYLSYYNIGVIFECLGLIEEGIEYYKKCGDYKLAKERLKILRK